MFSFFLALFHFENLYDFFWFACWFGGRFSLGEVSKALALLDAASELGD